MSESIKQLSEKEKVRMRISVWLGSNEHMAVLHCIKELLGNSADEIGKGNGDRIELSLYEDGKTVTIKDNCKGLPVEGINENGTPNYQLLFEHLFAGTKYDNGVGNSHYTVGTNGLFLAILSYSSQDVSYKIGRPNGNIYEVAYHKGDLSKEFSVTGKTEETFTEITFELDDDVFEENYYTINELAEIAKEQASLLKDGSILVRDMSNDSETTYHYENGIVEFLEEETSSLSNVSEIAIIDKEVSHTLEKEGTIDDIKIKLVFNYTKEDDGKTAIEFLNGSNLIHHGTIYEGLVNGFRSSIHKYIKDNGMYKKNEKQITKDDVMVGLNYVVDFKSYFPVYASQTKFASEVVYYKEIMQDAIKDFFDSYVLENKFEMERIANQVIGEKRARESAETVRMNVKKKLSGGSNILTSRVEGLIDCRSKDPKKREFAIVEGKSSLGAIVKGRDSNFQSVFPIRGKILSCLKAPLDRVLSNELIIDIYKCLGCGIEIGKKNSRGTFNINDLKYDKIIIMTDADQDGMSIRTLLLTMFYVLTPTLLREGKIYIVDAPLYEITNANGKSEEVFYAYSNQELDKVISENKLEKYFVDRNKGLGQMDDEAVSTTLMSPDTRRLHQITIKDVEEMKKYFELFMGDEVLPRRKFIEDNFDKYEYEV